MMFFCNFLFVVLFFNCCGGDGYLILYVNVVMCLVRH